MNIMNNRNILGTTIKAVGLSVMALVFGGMAWGQAPGIQWAKCYGGSGHDAPISVCQTSDGGYIMGGESSSTDGQVTGNHGSLDCWVVKTDSLGNLQWEKSYGGAGDDIINQLAIDVNGGYIIVAETNSSGGDVIGNHGGWDGWVIKINDTGGIVWDSVMGSTATDFFTGVSNTPDSGYLVVGSSGAANGNVPFNFGGTDAWIIKLSRTGAIIWNKVFGGPNTDQGIHIANTIDNGYLISSYTEGGGTITGYHGNGDAWLLKLNDTGGLQWNKCYGGTGNEGALCVVQKSNGNYIVGSWSNSDDGQVTGNHGDYDYWVFSTDDTGRLVWEKSYGGSGFDDFGSLCLTFDSNIIMAGMALNLDGDVTSSHTTTGGGDYWVLKTNDTGKIIWENTFGGSAGDTAFNVIQTTDSGYAVAGYTASNNWEVSGNHGNTDYWLVKLAKDPPLKVETIQSDPAIKVYPTLTNGVVYVELPQGYENANIVLTDVTGKKIQTRIAGQPNKRSVQISNLSEGMYLLNVVSHDRVSSFKVVYHP